MSTAGTGVTVGGMCANCVTGFVREGTPAGSLVTLATDAGPIEAYLAKADRAGAPTLLYLADVFGHTFKNSQLLADQYAKAGFNVVVPEYFVPGGAVPGDAMAGFMDAEPGRSFFVKLWSGLGVVRHVPTLVGFLSRNKEAVVRPRVDALVRAARAKAAELGGGPGAKLGAVGFCFGGRYAALLGKAGGGVDAFAAVHPSGIDLAKDLDNITAPGFFAFSEHDMQITAEVGAKVVKACPTTTHKWYPKQQHGFAVRGPPSSDAAREECCKDVVAFFAKALA